MALVQCAGGQHGPSWPHSDLNELGTEPIPMFVALSRLFRCNRELI